jgi:hypothetical protein
VQINRGKAVVTMAKKDIHPTFYETASVRSSRRRIPIHRPQTLIPLRQGGEWVCECWSCVSNGSHASPTRLKRRAHSTLKG